MRATEPVKPNMWQSLGRSLARWAGMFGRSATWVCLKMKEPGETASLWFHLPFGTILVHEFEPQPCGYELPDL